jgi:hypothetical protein
MTKLSSLMVPFLNWQRRVATEGDLAAVYTAVSSGLCVDRACRTRS